MKLKNIRAGVQLFIEILKREHAYTKISLIYFLFFCCMYFINDVDRWILYVGIGWGFVSFLVSFIHHTVENIKLYMKCLHLDILGSEEIVV